MKKYNISRKYALQNYENFDIGVVEDDRDPKEILKELDSIAREYIESLAEGKSSKTYRIGNEWFVLKDGKLYKQLPKEKIPPKTTSVPQEVAKPIKTAPAGNQTPSTTAGKPFGGQQGWQTSSNKKQPPYAVEQGWRTAEEEKELEEQIAEDCSREEITASQQKRKDEGDPNWE